MHQMRWEMRWNKLRNSIPLLPDNLSVLAHDWQIHGVLQTVLIPLMLTELAWILDISRIHTSSSRIFDVCATLVSQEFMNIVPVFMSVCTSIHELVRIWVHVPCLLFVTFVEEYHWITSQMISLSVFVMSVLDLTTFGISALASRELMFGLFFLPNAS